MSKIKSILTIIFCVIYRAVHFQFTHLYIDDCHNICTSPSYYYHQSGNANNYCLVLGHETMACAVCLVMFVSVKFDIRLFEEVAYAC